MAPTAYQRQIGWNDQVSRAALPPSITLSWVVQKLMVAAFAASFLQYWTHSAFAQYTHIVLLFTAGLTVLLGVERRQRLHDLLRGGSVLLLAVLFTEVISYYSGDRYSLYYGFVLIGVLLSARLVLLQIGLTGVMRSFFQVGIVITVFLAIVGRRGITGFTAGGNRFTGGGNAHPNLVAFVLAGFLPVMVWRFLEYKSVRKRRLVAGVCMLNVALIFFSGSRGTLLACMLSATALLLRLLISGRMKNRLRPTHIQVMLLLVAVPLFAFLLARHGRYEKVSDFLDTSLSLNSSQRGLHSGFSGRTAFWLKAFARLRQEQRWLFGFGYRMGDVLVGTIDDGYIQLLFESGLISGLMILGVLLAVFLRLWKATRHRANTLWLRYHLMLWCMLIIYMFNNISTRYLFSFGNCYSVCVIFMMMASRRELLGPEAGQASERSRQQVVQVRPQRAMPLAGLSR